MIVNLTVDRDSTKAELSAAAQLLNTLAADRGAKVVAPVADPAELQEPEVVSIGEVGTKVEGETKTRRRRTKAEIEAEKAAAEAKSQEDTISGESSVTPSTEPCYWEDTTGNFGIADDGVLPNAEAFVIDEARYDKLVAIAGAAAVRGENPGKVTTDKPLDEFETVANAGAGKSYTEPEVQALATLVARTKGASVVKDKIAELGGQRIAALTPEQLNELGAFLETQK